MSPFAAARDARSYNATSQTAPTSKEQDSNSVKGTMAPENPNPKLQKMKHYIDALCGVYSRIARRLGVDRTYVSKVAKGERHSPEIEAALVQEFDRSQKE
jgi:transcriptional regulator with XRE-family HTH domain